MKKLYKCKCGYICEEDKRGNACAKCGAPLETFELLSEESTNKIFNSDRTNDIHMELAALASKMIELANEGEEIKLDPGCVSVFNKVKDASWLIKQLCKAELAGHVKKEKF